MKHHIYEVDEYNVRNYRMRALALLSVGFLYTTIAGLAWALLQFELASPSANITNYADAFWALQMSASTIGFGDFYPVTLGGRMVVAAMFYIGVGIVGFIGALIAERVLGFADTNVKNRELRKQNTEILQHNIALEKKMDRLLAHLEQRS
jgi:voltage-gated potassium channel